MRLPVQTECRTRESPQALCARLRSDSNASQSTAELRDSSDRPSDEENMLPEHADANVCSDIETDSTENSMTCRFPFALRSLALDDMGAVDIITEPNKGQEKLPSQHFRSGSGAQLKNLAALCKMHACVHCHSSKTACTDVRPCPRCIRLGLDCSSERDQPRKRACKGCHAGKVACQSSYGAEKCTRCTRLGIACVPRSNPTSTSGSRKRRRSAIKSEESGTADAEVADAAEPPSDWRDMALNVAASLLQLSQSDSATKVADASQLATAAYPPSAHIDEAVQDTKPPHA
mmetsp:Transcript_25701/g.53840  ORF Transcript_25701/g.53840 Transcript_25701/m.53840 type:complete len:289 (+) Transcript_25701:77-943(+)